MEKGLWGGVGGRLERQGDSDRDAIYICMDLSKNELIGMCSGEKVSRSSPSCPRRRAVSPAKLFKETYSMEEATAMPHVCSVPVRVYFKMFKNIPTV